MNLGRKRVIPKLCKWSSCHLHERVAHGRDHTHTPKGVLKNSYLKISRCLRNIKIKSSRSGKSRYKDLVVYNETSKNSYV